MNRRPFHFHRCSRASILVAIVLFGLALGLRVPSIEAPSSLVFDEWLYLPAAGSYLRGEPDTFEGTHPPLFKALTALVIRTFGGIDRCGMSAPPLQTDGGTERLVGNGQVLEVGRDGVLRRRSDGSSETLAVGVGVARAVPEDGHIWVAIPKSHRVMAFDTRGRTVANVKLDGRPDQLAVVVDPQRGNSPHALRVVAHDLGTQSLMSVDPFTRRQVYKVRVGPATHITATQPGVIWMSKGGTIQTLEAFSGASLARTELGRTVTGLLQVEPDRAAAIAGNELICLRDRTLGLVRTTSAVAGASIVALTVLLAMRLAGSVVGAGLAGSFVLVDGMQITLSRLAMPEPALVALGLGAWFCATSAVFHSQPNVPGERTRFFWYVAAAAVCGAASSIKWSGVWVAIGIAVLLVWDAFNNGDRAVLRMWGISQMRILAVVASGVLVVGLVYSASWLPHLARGDTLADIVAMHGAMLDHHNEAAYTYNEAPWYQWLVGGRAVRIWRAATTSADPAELWLFPNGPLAIFGTASLAALAKRRDPRPIAPLYIPVLAAIVPWVFVGRATLAYHAAPLTPFLAIALAMWITKTPLARRRVRSFIGLLVAATILATSAWTLPVVYGRATTQERLDRIIEELRWQVRPPQFPWHLLATDQRTYPLLSSQGPVAQSVRAADS